MVEVERILEFSILGFTLSLFFFKLLKSKITQKPYQELISFYFVSFLVSNLIIYTGKLILKDNFLKNQGKSTIVLLTLMISPAIITLFYEPLQFISLKKFFGIFLQKKLYIGILVISASSILNPIASAFIWEDVHFSISSDTVLNNLKNFNLEEKDIQSIKDQLNINPIILMFIVIIQSIIAGCTINAAFAYGEERAWRDFVVKRFSQLGFGFWRTSFISGFLWGLWHYPVILFGYNFPNNPVAGVFMMSISCALLTPIFIKMTMIVPHVMTAPILHGLLNATAGFTVLMISGGIDLQNGILGFSCWIIFGIINLAIYFIDQNNKTI
eukprot:gene5275-8893_t